MSKFTDPVYLNSDQYRNSANLEARIALHRRFSVNPQGWFPWLWDRLEKFPAQAKVLELGCGSGAMWTACPERIPSGWSITLSDFSAGMLDSARANLQPLQHPFTFEQIDAQNIPFPDRTFDLILANFMLYHVPDRPRALKEIHRALKPGGSLIAATTGSQHLSEMHAWMERLDNSQEMIAFRNLFTLQNGLAQLQPLFHPVEILPYVDSLRITEIPPLMAYLRSTTAYSDTSSATFSQLEQELTTELQAKGAICVTKESGLFVARKSEKLN